jgi:L-ascorbate metabolism protein UlaG (beta-lactamase superfamily)
MKSYQNGKFTGRYDSSTEVNLFRILKWKFFSKRESFAKKVLPLEVIRTPEKLLQKEDFICWLSHASFLIQLGGKRIVIDPVFGDIPFYKRKIPAPYSVEELGALDYLLLSHVHYDHFDTPSLKGIAKKAPKAILPLHMSKVLHKTASTFSTKELDWYESIDEEGLTITLVPAMHWGRRGFFDKNRVLWGGYVLQYKGTTIYFAGDTAKGEHFKEIGKRFDIDYALLPIGAYKPEFIMKHNHLNPQEAFEAFESLGAKKMIPMHYGTYNLTDEPLDEPLEWIQKIDREHPKQIQILKAGEVLTL